STGCYGNKGPLSKDSRPCGARAAVPTGGGGGATPPNAARPGGRGGDPAGVTDATPSPDTPRPDPHDATSLFETIRRAETAEAARGPSAFRRNVWSGVARARE